MGLSPRHVAPRVAELLTQQELHAIHEAALRVLDEVGVAARGPELRRLLAGQSGLTHKGDRLHFAPWLVQDHVDAYRAANGSHPPVMPDDRIALATSCCGRYVVDMDTDAIRPASWVGAAQAIQLAEAMRAEGVSSSVPLVPQEIPAPLHALAECLLSARHSRNGMTFVQPCSLEGLEWVYRMHQVMGQPFRLVFFVVSPLQLDGDSLQTVLHFRERAQILQACSMPTRGARAPVHLVGGFVQSIAETLAGLVVLRLIAGNARATIDLDAFAFDMREMTISYGSPEMNLADMVKLQLGAYYGMPATPTRFIRSMAKRPGFQAAAEKSASAMAGALAGARRFYGGGQLAVDEVFSLEQLVLDREIVDYAQHLARGFDVGEAELAVDIIREAVASGGDYLGHPSTVAAHRRAFWGPAIFEHSMLRAWQERGEPDIRAAARARVRELLARPGAYRLAPDKDAQLAALFGAAWVALLGSPCPLGPWQAGG